MTADQMTVLITEGMNVRTVFEDAPSWSGYFQAVTKIEKAMKGNDAQRVAELYPVVASEFEALSDADEEDEANQNRFMDRVKKYLDSKGVSIPE